MTDTLLQSLRDHMLDESEPLAGLLRKCLLLGAETGSDSLREWARHELNGYADEEEVPEYRVLQSVPISVDSTSGNRWVTGEVIDRIQLPREAWEHVPEALNIRQPVEELERLAGQKSLSFGSPGLAVAKSIWNRRLGPFQSIVGLTYVMSGSVIAGIVGQIRTKLVDIVADLTSATPLAELPKKERVDAAVNERVGRARDVYNTTIHGTAGPTAIGSRAKATAEGMGVEDVLNLLREIERAGEGIQEDERAELEEAVAELREAVEQQSPDTGEVVKKVGKLRTVADKVGLAAVSAAASSAATTLTDMALNGAFN